MEDGGRRTEASKTGDRRRETGGRKDGMNGGRKRDFCWFVMILEERPQYILQRRINLPKLPQ